LFIRLLTAGFVSLLSLVGGFVWFGGASTEAAPAPKVQLCHHTSSATNPIVVIEVSGNAVPAHLAHGDAFFGGMTSTGDILCFLTPTPAPGG